MLAERSFEIADAMIDEAPKAAESDPAADAKEVSSGSKLTKVGIIVAIAVASIILGLAN